jgi:hypothetical protein
VAPAVVPAVFLRHYQQACPLYPAIYPSHHPAVYQQISSLLLVFPVVQVFQLVVVLLADTGLDRVYRLLPLRVGFRLGRRGEGIGLLGWIDERSSFDIKKVVLVACIIPYRIKEFNTLDRIYLLKGKRREDH